MFAFSSASAEKNGQGGASSQAVEGKTSPKSAMQNRNTETGPSDSGVVSEKDELGPSQAPFEMKNGSKQSETTKRSLDEGLAKPLRVKKADNSTKTPSGDSCSGQSSVGQLSSGTTGASSYTSVEKNNSKAMEAKVSGSKPTKNGDNRANQSKHNIGSNPSPANTAKDGANNDIQTNDTYKNCQNNGQSNASEDAQNVKNGQASDNSKDTQGTQPSKTETASAHHNKDDQCILGTENKESDSETPSRNSTGSPGESRHSTSTLAESRNSTSSSGLSDNGAQSSPETSPESPPSAGARSFVAVRKGYFDRPRQAPSPVPLSMRFIHKPSRSQEEYTKASDPTRRNSAINAGLVDAPASPSPVPEDYPEHSLVRKKSGEIVKSSLKEHTPRSRSLPSTPTYKSVHFGGDADVRYFSQKDRPAAISASNSPVLATDDDDMDDPGADLDLEVTWDSSSGPADSAGGLAAPPRDSAFPQWSVDVLNFPPLSYHERMAVRHMPVFLEHMFVSADQRYLLGQVAVHNMAYEKSVVVRYSPDAWSTTKDLDAIYVPDTPPVLRAHNYDRFIFKLDLAKIGERFPAGGRWDYEFCVRFTTPDCEYWDNNSGSNYMVRLERRPRPKQRAVSAAAVSKADRSQRPKPKYSASFLRRQGESDFDRNNFYLSSPLLSSLGVRDESELPQFRAHTDESVSPNSAPVSPPDSPDPLSNTPNDLADRQNLSPNSRPSQTSRTPKDISSMSYRELLDSFCFFSPSRDASTSTLVMSDEPNVSFDRDRARGPSGDPDAPFTVSSFLRH
ncbi:putative phosphatase regulatory subunit family protein [Clavispora lusitaniae]|uniref:putative phosphatase regulatory subunit family protein n=1 Tax=Clavispora lusitaniae TaxID=36911 RepID=UPI00202BBF56|nr:putative phosphatase regulatory subunit family protein [Clavispora lusitaniae]